ncbi:MAG: threonine aldolase [Lachnospiraceae bacterium]|nr:threonine aldolase [Lachnospiraceae bacterium]
MIYFRSDYSQGAHPKVLEALAETNFEHTDGYGMDEHCTHAAAMVKALIGRPDCDVHMMIGGTPCNVTIIASTLRPYESVIAARTGHIYVHETGAVEGTGHRIVTVEGVNGKLTPEGIEKACMEHDDEHTAEPKMVYISQPTEIGTIYSRQEMIAISEKCKEKGLYLYVDGARLGCALTSREADLSIQELARLCDAFYIGGTKNGALFGEALVILNPGMKDHFRYMIKHQCGMLAKGRLIGVQFEALLADGEYGLYFQIAAHSNAMAEKLTNGLKDLGVEFFCDSPTNQIFPIFPPYVLQKLEEEFFFYQWAPEEARGIPVRLVTGWGTKEEEVDRFLAAVKEAI